MIWARVWSIGALCMALSACDGGDAAPESAHKNAPAARLDSARLASAANEPGQWFTAGRDGEGTYFSPLTQINASNVDKLGFAWGYELGTQRGLEATPIVIDGVMYAVGNWGRVYALAADTGRELWTFTPTIEGQAGRYACCDAVSRGIAVWQGRVYVAALDGWLYALDAAGGEQIWKADTLIGREQRVPYTITGAPLIAGDAVVIGNGGADFGVRGYVTAYDLASGKQKWRFFTVPRDPALGPQEQAHLQQALATWDPHSDWRRGGGGTVWDGMAYDPELELVYIGTGNASPYEWKERSPKGGDNLYLASIVAIHADSGEMAWFYQQVPQERWDYTATAKMVLGQLKIDGKPRKVIMQAPKNGFFYVLDRASGELLAAHPYAYVNWAKSIDPRSGRPILNPQASYENGPKLIYPGMGGAHNWHPMSFDPRTGLMYIPVLEVPMVYIRTGQRPVKEMDGMFNVAGLYPEIYDPEALRSVFGPLPSIAELAKGIPAPASSRGVLKAFDPVSGRVVWEQPGHPWDGGVMSTAGNLVIRGDAAGHLNVYASDTGAKLHQIEVGTSIMAAPMSYEVGGEQYVAVMAGFGGGGGFMFTPDTAAYRYGNRGRILAFKLGGGATPKPAEVVQAPFPEPPARRGAQEQIRRGELLYARHCSRCHVLGPGLLPDLRRMSAPTHEIFDAIVLQGAYQSMGMGRFDDVLQPSDAKAVQAFIIEAAWQAYESENAGEPRASH